MVSANPNLYKSLSLLRDAESGRITQTIAEEGGLNSACWSGVRKRGEDGRLRLAARFDRLRYSIEIGFPAPAEAAFSGEPMIKSKGATTIEGLTLGGEYREEEPEDEDDS
jgi:predicted ATPase